MTVKKKEKTKNTRQGTKKERQERETRNSVNSDNLPATELDLGCKPFFNLGYFRGSANQGYPRGTS